MAEKGRARIILETLPALAILALAVTAAALARAFRPDLPPSAVFGTGALIACGALLLPRFRRLAAVELLFENDIFFMAGVVAALVWANVEPHSYGETASEHNVKFAVNEVLMAFFFGVAAKEVREAFLPGGPLASIKRAAMPLVATAGGMVGPALIFFAGAHLFGRGDLARGWAIPTATDIAFSAVVARAIFGATHPAIPFLLLLAIADDAGGLAILAIFYTKPDGLPWLGLVLVGMAVCWLLSRFGKVQSPWPYVLLGGGLAWVGMHESGMHPALALVPIVPLLPVPPRAEDSGIFDTHVGAEPADTLNRFEETLSAPVSLILGLFGLVNAGVPLGGFGTATWLVLAGLVLGKPIGISLAVALGKVVGLEVPEGLRPLDIVVLGITAGIGFTVALFVATVAYPPGPDLDAAKMGALGSVLASFASIALGRLSGVERRP